MKPIFARINSPYGTRKIMLDMAYLASHKVIRLPKYYYEEGLFIPYKPDPKNNKIEKFTLSKDKAESADEHFYYFNFPLKPAQVENVAI